MGVDELSRTAIAVDPLVGTVIDRRYRIEFRLAAGGFGAIYRAIHVITGRHVALKVLHATLATEPDVVARFRREAAALGQLHNPHTIKAFDFGETPDGMLYIVMELLQGETLYERFLGLGPFPWPRLVAIIRQVCSSLEEAHDLGIVHRDLKPTNIHLEEIGGDPDFVKVLDFGIAKILHGSRLEASDLTRSGHVVGTFEYMAPEQMVGAPTTGQSDIYTVGIVMYEMLTGERPFGTHNTPAAMLTAVLSTTPPPVSSLGDAPAELDAVIARCLDRDPAHRFHSIVDLSEELDRILNSAKTQIVKLARSATDVALSDDSLTWIDQVPPAAPATIQHPFATLPGIIPPKKR
jgi:eukaryotic-like serine/threonine-protein kinase